MNADQTHTVRLPTGVANRLKAATGQPLSFLVRCMCIALLQKYEAEGRFAASNVKDAIRSDVNKVVQSTDLPEEPDTDGQASD